MLKDREDQAQFTDKIALLWNLLRLGTGKAGALLNLIQGATNENVAYLVDTGRKSLVVSGWQIKCISCLAKTDLKIKTEMLFQPKVNLSLNEKLEFTCQLVNISCSLCKVNIYVRNTTQHDITIPGRTIIGSIQKITVCNSVCSEEHQVNLVVIESTRTSPNTTTEKPQSHLQDKRWGPPVNIYHLGDDQQALVKQIFREDSGSLHLPDI